MIRIKLPPPATAATLKSLSEKTSDVTASIEVLISHSVVTTKTKSKDSALQQMMPAEEPEVIESKPNADMSNSSPVIAGGFFLPDVAAFIASHVRVEAEQEAALWLKDTKGKLRQALRNYGLDAEILGERLTPNAALVRFKGTDKMTVAEVEKRRGVLLTSHALDVIGVRPEKGEVVVMVARDKRAILDLCESWRRRVLPTSAPEANSSFVIGEKENDGHLLYLNLGAPFEEQPQHGPHTLIAGETGGGKGVLVRNLILDICATNSPSSARIRLIDPKGGADFSWISRLPHLDGGLVTTQAEAVETLKQLVSIMEERYALITPVASNIDRYNAKVEIHQRLPRIYLFHDELGDWMADKDNASYREAVESYVVRLGAKARAAGIHLFLITQRPDKDALPGQIKANMGNKICLRVSSQTNSRIVLDENGAETLLGNGHFGAKLANEKPSNQSSVIYGQSPFLEDDDAYELANVIATSWS